MKKVGEVSVLWEEERMKHKRLSSVGIWRLTCKMVSTAKENAESVKWRERKKNRDNLGNKKQART